MFKAFSVLRRGEGRSMGEREGGRRRRYLEEVGEGAREKKKERGHS